MQTLRETKEQLLDELDSKEAAAGEPSESDQPAPESELPEPGRNQAIGMFVRRLSVRQKLDMFPSMYRKLSERSEDLEVHRQLVTKVKREKKQLMLELRNQNSDNSSRVKELEEQVDHFSNKLRHLLTDLDYAFTNLNALQNTLDAADPALVQETYRGDRYEASSRILVQIPHLISTRVSNIDKRKGTDREVNPMVFIIFRSACNVLRLNAELTLSMNRLASQIDARTRRGGTKTNLRLNTANERIRQLERKVKTLTTEKMYSEKEAYESREAWSRESGDTVESTISRRRSGQPFPKRQMESS